MAMAPRTTAVEALILCDNWRQQEQRNHDKCNQS